ncbi:MAG TPA: PAS domain-containing sensor histidine kinase [Gemmatimonadaceae bacterium]|nr:PAS domain-containing sensor histidine kinase [Gemmatimonadaceae bacterium]
MVLPIDPARTDAPMPAPGDAALLGQLLDALPVGVAFVDVWGRYLRVNACLAAMNGRTPAAHVGCTPREVLGEEEGAQMEAIVRQVAESGTAVGPVQAASGAAEQRRHFTRSYHPVRDASGAVSIVQVIVAEDTERWRAAERQAMLMAVERHAREHAEAASQAKSGFLASLSHEIRNPVNAIVGYAELLEMGLSGPLTEAQRRQVGRIRESSRHLLSLLRDVIDLAKVEAGRLMIARERGSASVAIDSALMLVRPQATDRRIEISWGSTRGGIAYMGDPHRVRQILANLLANAVRYTDPGGRVAIACGLTDIPDPRAVLDPEQPCWCTMSVEDTGIGIAPELLESIFDPFMQGDPRGRSARGGAGLGLTISRRLARLMGGDITVRSRLGEGSMFTVWLPAPPVVVPDGEQMGGCSIVERRGAARSARGLVAVGEAVLGDVDGIIARYVRRLRDDPGIPGTHHLTGTQHLTDTELSGHTATLLADLAQSLEIIEESEGESTELMRDGSEIQRVIADRHGRLRAQLGWSAAALDRDYDLLRDEIVTSVRRDAPRGAALEEGVSVVLRLLDRARAMSQMALRRAEPGV